MFGKETYIQRRNALKKNMSSGLLLFLGNDEVGFNYEDNTYPFRQDSTFLYFFGLPFIGLAAVIDIDNDEEIIFGDELTIDAIVWMGTQPTLQEKCDSAGIIRIMPANELESYLKKAVQKKQTIHYLPPYRSDHRMKLWSFLDILPGKENPSIDLVKNIVNLRNYKTEEEVEEIQKACLVTTDMHLAAIEMIKPGICEYEIVAAIENVARSRNLRPAFQTIATINGQTLHNHYYGNTIRKGDLFLLDAGAETEMGYSGDMSSTVPADSCFTSRQREIYEIQVASMDAAIQELKPGVRFDEVYDRSAQVIVDGLKSLGLMKGDTQEAVSGGAHALFYPHGLGHMMGLDVHDMESLGEIYVGFDGQPKSKQLGRKSLRLARELEPGFVHTIEPGIYFIPELIDQWKSKKQLEAFINYDRVEAYKDFGGIRNEEDYLITETGCQLLGKKISRKPEDIEALREKAFS